jgi:ergothioneine biosynthesis protein EgtB
MSQVMDYRAHIDDGLRDLFAQGYAEDETAAHLIETGVNHEQQHQELLLVDVLALFAANPLRPAYRTPRPVRSVADSDDVGWLSYPGGIRAVGHEGAGFAWDNESPHHDVLLHPYRLADRLVTCGDWLDFIADGGYRQAALWLADGWATVNREGWEAPLYWENCDNDWHGMTLDGFLPVDRAAPVAHVSYFEADAFARWAGKRLPTEFEWEAATQGLPVAGNTLASGALRPLAAPARDGLPRQMFGDVWEWTQSAFSPYPGYRPPAGAIGEYNGKFMVSQHVLRGGSCVTPQGHTRPTYRNFFYPQQRRQFVGLRLASE